MLCGKLRGQKVFEVKVCSDKIPRNEQAGGGGAAGGGVAEGGGRDRESGRSGGCCALSRGTNHYLSLKDPDPEARKPETMKPDPEARNPKP